MKIDSSENLSGMLPELKQLLDLCYPKPPQNVFFLLMEQYRVGFPVYTAIKDAGELVGFTYLNPNSKGGTVECLAVHPEFRRKGLGSQLVTELLTQNPGVIQITTRIPSFFERLGFDKVTVLPDQSYFMIKINFSNN